jgi:hypothetical protein
MKGRLKKIWQHRGLILEGILNSVIVSQEIEDVASSRESICKTCPHYDPKGESEKVFVKGSPACSICGCNITFLTHSMHSQCSLHEIGQEPLWLPELTKEEEESLPK